MKKNNIRGFTLIEIMMVVAIISGIIVISIPNINRMRINANEKATISALKIMHTALETYHDMYNTYPKFGKFDQFLINSNPPLLPSSLSLSSTYYGYNFSYNPYNPISGATEWHYYTLLAKPSNVSGARPFVLLQGIGGVSVVLGAIPPPGISAMTNGTWIPIP